MTIGKGMRKMTKVEKAIPNLKVNTLCLSACYIAIGTVLLALPVEIANMVSICYGIGIAAIIVGLINVAIYFIRKGYLQENNLGFSVGVAAVIFGLFAVLQTENFAVAFTQVLAFCMIADSIIKLQFSMDLLRLKGKWWWIVLIAALTSAGLAMMILLSPFQSEDTKHLYTYIVLIVDGLLNIGTIAYLSWQLKRFRSGALQKQEDVPEDAGDEEK